MTSSNQGYYGDDDASASRLRHRHRHHVDPNRHYHDANHAQGHSHGANYDGSNHDNVYRGETHSRLDPCHVFPNEACMDACNTMSAINQAAMCGGVFHNYFNLNHEEDGDALSDRHSSAYLYSSSAPVGPQSCEYCGQRNTRDCPSNLPREFLTPAQGGDDHGESSDGADGGVGNNIRSGDENAAKSDGSGGGDPDERNETCHRPKLFFLKKRPPFATPDGWNPATEYRSNLFEPPSTADGMGRGWGEVRGHLGANANAMATSSARLDRSHVSGGCGGSSACGVAETEISFGSATGGGDRGSATSPVHWVSGLMGALSPS